MRVAFIGLGVMGYPMAGHLVRAGHEVTVFNRTSSRAERWAAEYGGNAMTSPRAAAGAAEVVFSCVGDDDDVRDVLLGAEGALAGIAPGAMLVDHTTASARVAREVAAAAAERRVAFLDAPVSGGEAGAVNGQLTIMAGGTAADFERAAHVMDAYAKAMTLIGPVASGQLAKMVNQICIAGIVQGLAEGSALCRQGRPR